MTRSEQLGIMELYLTLNTEERQLLGQQYPQEKQRMNQLTARWYEEGRIEERQQGRLDPIDTLRTHCGKNTLFPVPPSPRPSSPPPGRPIGQRLFPRNWVYNMLLTSYAL